MSGLTDTIDRLSRRVKELELDAARINEDRGNQRTKVRKLEQEAKIMRRDNRLERQRLFKASNSIKALAEETKKAKKAVEDLEYRHHRQVGDEVTVLLAKRIENLKYTLMDFVLGRYELDAENKEETK